MTLQTWARSPSASHGLSKGGSEFGGSCGAALWGCVSGTGQPSGEQNSHVRTEASRQGCKKCLFVLKCSYLLHYKCTIICV